MASFSCKGMLNFGVYRFRNLQTWWDLIIDLTKLNVWDFVLLSFVPAICNNDCRAYDVSFLYCVSHLSGPAQSRLTDLYISLCIIIIIILQSGCSIAFAIYFCFVFLETENQLHAHSSTYRPKGKKFPRYQTESHRNQRWKFFAQTNQYLIGGKTGTKYWNLRSLR